MYHKGLLIFLDAKSSYDQDWYQIHFSNKPIFFLIDSESIDLIEKCYQEFNKNFATKSNSLSLFTSQNYCYARMRTFWKSAVNSNLCLRRSYQLSLSSFFHKLLFFGSSTGSELLCFKHRTSFWTSISKSARKPNSTILILAKLEKLKSLKPSNNLKPFKSFSNIIFLGLADLVYKFRQKLDHKEYDVVFAYILEDNLDSNQSVSLILSKAIQQDKFNFGEGTNFNFSKLRKDNLKSIIEIGDLSWPNPELNYQDRKFYFFSNKSNNLVLNSILNPIQLENIQDLSGSLLKNFLTNLPHLDGFFLSSEFDYLNEFVNFYKYDLKSDNQTLDFILNYSMEIILEISKIIFEIFDLNIKKNELESRINKEHLKEMVKCFLASSCESHLKFPSSFKEISYLMNFSSIKVSSDLCQKGRNCVKKNNSLNYFSRILETRELDNLKWALSKELAQPQLEIFLKQNSSVNFLEILISLFSILMTIVFLFYFRILFFKN